MSDPIQVIRAPMRLTYNVTAGASLSRFLDALALGRIVGCRCLQCQKVCVPPRPVCPTCCVLADEEVAVSDAGTVTTYCIVNVPFEGQTVPIPYVYANIVLDGADLPLLHVVDVPVTAATMGLRVRAAWLPPGERGPTLASIRCFLPTGEPNAPFESYKDHL